MIVARVLSARGNEAPWIRRTAIGLISYGVVYALATAIQPFGDIGRLIISDIAYIPSSLSVRPAASSQAMFCSFLPALLLVSSLC